MMSRCSYVDMANEPKAVVLSSCDGSKLTKSCCDAKCESLKLYQHRRSHTEDGQLETMRVSSRSPIARWAPMPLRLIVGYGFVEHGFSKLLRGPDAFATTLQAIGVPGPHFMAWFNMSVELLGGLAVILGALVVLVSVPMADGALDGYLSVHLPYGFLSINLITVTAAGARFGPPGYETDPLYLACLAALVVGGPGPLAIDNLIGKRSGVGDLLEKRTKLNAPD